MNIVFHEEPFTVTPEDDVWEQAASIRQQVDDLLKLHPAGTTIEFTGKPAEQWKWANAVFDEASRVSARWRIDQQAATGEGM